MRRLHFVVNPVAGRGRALTIWNQLQNKLSERAHTLGFAVSITHSFVGEALSDIELHPDTILVSVGGDGSVHYTAIEALKRGLRLGVVAAGTGNDYVRNLGLPVELHETIDILLTGREQAVDVIQINDNFAFNLAGYGIDAEVVHWIEKRPWLKKIGRLGYGFVVPAVLLKHRRFHLSIQCDDGELQSFRDVSIFAVANGALFGGGMKIAPGASPYDGKLNVVLACGLSKLAILRLFPKIYRGTHVTLPQVTCLTAKKLTVKFTDSQTAAEYDGEAYSLTPHAGIGIGQKIQVIMPDPEHPFTQA